MKLSNTKHVRMRVGWHPGLAAPTALNSLRIALQDEPIASQIQKLKSTGISRGKAPESDVACCFVSKSIGSLHPHCFANKSTHQAVGAPMKVHAAQHAVDICLVLPWVHQHQLLLPALSGGFGNSGVESTVAGS